MARITRVFDRIEEKAAEFIRLHGLFAGAGRVLLAVSGGTDSTALLHILHSLRAAGSLSAELVCAHVNHQLRGSASDEDEQFVVAQATRLGVPTVTRAVDVRACAKAHRLSIETAARRLRLESLREIARACDCAWVATGHQKNDNVETILHRVRRGTGFRGLAGIRPARRLDEGLWLGRPLLDVTREEILGYLDRRTLEWREDHTNVDPAYTRNYIRHKLLPALQKESCGPLIDELSQLAASAGRLRDRVRREAQEALSRCAAVGAGEVVLTASSLAALPELVGVELIRHVLVTLGCGERDLTRDHYAGIIQLARNAAETELSLPRRFSVRRERDTLVLSRIHTPEPVPALSSVGLRVPGETWFAGHRIEARILDAAQLPMEQIKRDRSPFCEYLDLDRIGQPVTVRPRRTGDRFRPLGMENEKKLGKFLTTAKVPQGRREQILVFADPTRIIWVCPVRIGEPGKVTNQTRRILMLKVTYDQ
ncbi:MAG: tRNA lysidine(34) synthetase TilS [Sedimentisphaerales bacterium]|nr:tRNA lysidine(34) synthetase TilS [Sedimentisphaerales bacterium]